MQTKVIPDSFLQEILSAEEAYQAVQSPDKGQITQLLELYQKAAQLFGAAGKTDHSRLFLKKTEILMSKYQMSGQTSSKREQLEISVEGAQMNSGAMVQNIVGKFIKFQRMQDKVINQELQIQRKAIKDRLALRKSQSSRQSSKESDQDSIIKDNFITDQIKQTRLTTNQPIQESKSDKGERIEQIVKQSTGKKKKKRLLIMNGEQKKSNKIPLQLLGPF